jgi:hypothetical protein
MQVTQENYKPKSTRKFSQSCANKQEFIDLIIELREKANNHKYDPENLNSTKEEQQAFANGEWIAYDLILNEITKNYDTKTY